MPRVIARNAAAGDILADCATTLRRGRERGGAIGAEIERFLGPVMAESAEVVAASAAADRADRLAREAVAVRAREVRLRVGATYDELWNALERPRHDARLAQWFPQNARTATTGPVEGMPIRVRIVADSIRKTPHPLLPLDRCLALADALADSADRLQAAVDRTPSFGQRGKPGSCRKRSDRSFFLLFLGSRVVRIRSRRRAHPFRPDLVRT
jgi:hypothetical protein